MSPCARSKSSSIHPVISLMRPKGLTGQGNSSSWSGLTSAPSQGGALAVCTRIAIRRILTLGRMLEPLCTFSGTAASQS
jgi:hypothetical protein